MRTAKRVNLAVALIAQRASESAVRASAALLDGSAGWRVRVASVEDEGAGILDEIIAACKLLAMIKGESSLDPRHEFLLAQDLRDAARLLVTFEHIKAEVHTYEWRPSGLVHKNQQERAAMYKKGARAELYTLDEPQTNDLSSTWAIWTELNELHEGIKEHECGGLCQPETCVAKRLKDAHESLKVFTHKFVTESYVDIDKKRKLEPKKHMLKAHTRHMPEFLNQEEEFNHADIADGIMQKLKYEREEYFDKINTTRKKKVDDRGTENTLKNYSERIVGRVLNDVGGETANLVKATEDARSVILEVREAMRQKEEDAMREKEEKEARWASARALVVVSAREQQHWFLSFAKTMGDVWLEAKGYTTTVSGDNVHVHFARAPVEIVPRPTTRAHYVVPCVTDGERAVYYLPTTGKGALHTLVAGDTSPLYDVARRSVSARRDALGARKFTVVHGIESAFGSALKFIVVHGVKSAFGTGNEASGRELASDMHSGADGLNTAQTAKKAKKAGAEFEDASSDMHGGADGLHTAQTAKKAGDEELASDMHSGDDGQNNDIDSEEDDTDVPTEIEIWAANKEYRYEEYVHTPRNRNIRQLLLRIGNALENAARDTKSSFRAVTDALAEKAKGIWSYIVGDSVAEDEEKFKVLINGAITLLEQKNSLRINYKHLHDLPGLLYEYVLAKGKHVRNRSETMQTVLFGTENFVLEEYAEIRGAGRAVRVVYDMWRLLRDKQTAKFVQAELNELGNVDEQTLYAVLVILEEALEAPQKNAFEPWVRVHVTLSENSLRYDKLQFLGVRSTLQYALTKYQQMYFPHAYDLTDDLCEILRNALKCEWSGDSDFLSQMFEVMQQVVQSDENACCLPLMLMGCVGLSSNDIAQVMPSPVVLRRDCKCHVSFVDKLRKQQFLQAGKGESGLHELLTKLTTREKKTIEKLKEDEALAYLLCNVDPKLPALMSKHIRHMMSIDRAINNEMTFALALEHGLSEDSSDYPLLLFKFDAREKKQSLECLDRLVTFASSDAPSKGIFKKNRLLEFEFEKRKSAWRELVAYMKTYDGDGKALAQLDTIEGRVWLHTKLPHMVKRVETFFAIDASTLPELLKQMREGGETYTDTRAQMCKDLSKDAKSTYFPLFDENGEYGQFKNCEFRCVHLIEYDRAEGGEQGKILDYIEGCKCNMKCLQAISARALQKQSDIQIGARFFTEINAGSISGDFRARVIRWREDGCNLTAESLLCGGDDKAKELFEKTCIYTTDLSNKLLLDEQDCERDEVKRALRDGTELPIYAQKEHKHELKEKVAASQFKNAIQSMQRRSSEARGNRANIAGLDILVFVHYTYVHKYCDAVTKAAYIQAVLNAEEEGWFKSTLAFEQLQTTSAVAVSNEAGSWLNTKMKGPKAYHWKQIANDITRDTWHNTGQVTTQTLGWMRDLLKERNLKNPEYDAPADSSITDFLHAAASVETLDLAITSLEYEFSNASENFPSLVTEIREKTGRSGETTSEGVLRLEDVLGIKTLERLLGDDEIKKNPYLLWMLRCARGARAHRNINRLVSLSSDSDDKTQNSELAKYVLALLSAIQKNDNDYTSLKEQINERNERKQTTINLTPADNAQATVLRSIASVISALLEVHADKRGLKDLLVKYQLAYSETPIIPHVLRRIANTNELSRQKTDFTRLVENSPLTNAQRRALLNSRTVSEAQQALTLLDASASSKDASASSKDASFGTKTAKQLVFEIVQKMEKKQEIPPDLRINDAKDIDDETPIVTTPTGFVDLAFHSGGLYRILGSDDARNTGRWVRVLAGRYGEERDAELTSIYYQAQMLYAVSGMLASFDRDDKKSRNHLHMPGVEVRAVRHKRAKLGITILHTRGARAEDVWRIQVESERVMRTSSSLWRLPCEGTCDSVVYVCCDRKRHDTADVVTLVLDSELGKVLEKLFAESAGPRKPRAIIKRLLSMHRADPSETELEVTYKRKRDHYDIVRSLDKKRPDAVSRGEKDVTVTVHAPELRLLHCFAPLTKETKIERVRKLWDRMRREALPVAENEKTADEAWTTAIGKLFNDLTGRN